MIPRPTDRSTGAILHDILKEGARRQMLSHPPWTANQLAESLRKDFSMIPTDKIEEAAETLSSLPTEVLEEILYVTGDDAEEEDGEMPEGDAGRDHRPQVAAPASLSYDSLGRPSAS